MGSHFPIFFAHSKPKSKSLPSPRLSWFWLVCYSTITITASEVKHRIEFSALPTLQGTRFELSQDEPASSQSSRKAAKSLRSSIPICLCLRVSFSLCSASTFAFFIKQTPWKVHQYTCTFSLWPLFLRQTYARPITLH